MRLAFAILASTLSVAVVGGLALWAAVLHSKSEEGIGVGISIVLAYTVSAAIGILLVGLPIHALISRSGKAPSFTPYLMAGMTVPFALTFALRPFGDSEIKQLVAQALISSILGAICSMVFWFIAARQSPNNTGKPV